MTDTTISNLKRRFLEYLEIEKGRSLKTIENYERYLDRFFAAAKIQTAGDITTDAVREFRLWLNRQQSHSGQNLSRRTQNYYLIALRSFLKYLHKQDIHTLTPDKIELAKTPMREIELVTRAEFDRLMNTTNGQDLSDLRDKAIFELLYCTGLRVSELCGLNQDIDLTVDEFTIRGKGDKIRLVFLSNRARTAVKDYLDARHRDDKLAMHQALFVSERGNRINSRAVQRIVERRAQQAGIMKHVTPHTLRHYFATNLLQNGADIRSVQMMLGHASINTTQVYTNLSDKYLKEVHQKFHASDETEF